MRSLCLLVVFAAACNESMASGRVRDAGVAAPVAAPAGAGFDGKTGWVVLGDSHKDHARALAVAHKLRAAGVPSSVVQSKLFANLRPGYAAVVHGRFDDRAAANARAAQIRDRVPKVYVKKTGAIVSAGKALPHLVRIHGTMEHAGDRSPRVRVTTPDGTIVTRPDAQDTYELWVATAGEIHVVLDGKEKEFPDPCSVERITGEFWAGPYERHETIDGSAPEVQINLFRWIEINPCD